MTVSRRGGLLCPPFQATRRTTLGQAMRGWSRLFVIEFRRSPAMVAALLIAAMTTYIMWDSLPEGVVRWREINNSAAEVPPIYASLIIGAFAAYRSGVIRQRKMLDQIETTTYPGALHDLCGFLSVAVWGIIGYLLPVVAFWLLGALRATWGEPDVMRPLLAIVTIVMASSFGWLFGSLIRHRIAPLITIATLLVLLLADDFTRNIRITMIQTGPGAWQSRSNDGWWHHLVPNNVLTATYTDQIGTRVVAWLLCLAVVFWLLTLLVRERTRTMFVAFVSVAIIASGAATSVVAFKPVRGTGQQIAFGELVCAMRLDEQITVCVHPQNASLLDATADEVAHVVEPLAAISGTPRLFIEGYGEDAYDHQGVPVNLYDLTTIRDGSLHGDLIRYLLMTRGPQPGFIGWTSPQQVVAMWLLDQAGQDVDAAIQAGWLYPLSLAFHMDHAMAAGLALDEYFREREAEYGEPGGRQAEAAVIAEFERDVDAALERFIAMPDDERAAWLEANWNVLIAGKLTLEDLP